MKLQNGFIAYSANPPGIGETIERAVSTCLQRASAPRVKSWRFLETFGHFISDQVLAEIETQDVLIADITHLNFNVLYEIGFAIGKRKPIGIIRNRTLNVEELNIAELGIFDTIGYETYDNADDLLKLFLSKHDYSALDIPLGRNSRSPIYLVESKYKTDFVKGSFCCRAGRRDGAHPLGHSIW